MRGAVGVRGFGLAGSGRCLPTRLASTPLAPAPLPPKRGERGEERPGRATTRNDYRTRGRRARGQKQAAGVISAGAGDRWGR
jgi:hypothetical protein